jgi:hypothetical protein
MELPTTCPQSRGDGIFSPQKASKSYLCAVKNIWGMILLCGLLLLLGLAGPISAQVLVSPRSAWEAFEKKPKIFGGFDSHRSFINNRDVNIFGVRVGLEFDHRVRMAVGAYTLQSDFQRQFVVPRPSGLDTIDAKLRYSHLTYILEYIALTSKRWAISFPVAVGLAEANFPQVPGFQKQQFMLGSLGMYVQYKIFPFLGIAGGVGYRTILVGSPLITENFNGPTYSFGVKLYLGWFIRKAREWRDTRRATS